MTENQEIELKIIPVKLNAKNRYRKKLEVSGPVVSMSRGKKRPAEPKTNYSEAFLEAYNKVRVL